MKFSSVKTGRMPYNHDLSMEEARIFYMDRDGLI